MRVVSFLPRVALSLGKEAPIIKDSRVDGLQSSSEHCGEEKTFLPLLRVERWLLGRASPRLAFSLITEKIQETSGEHCVQNFITASCVEKAKARLFYLLLWYARARQVILRRQHGLKITEEKCQRDCVHLDLRHRHYGSTWVRKLLNKHLRIFGTFSEKTQFSASSSGNSTVSGMKTGIKPAFRRNLVPSSPWLNVNISIVTELKPNMEQWNEFLVNSFDALTVITVKMVVHGFYTYTL